MALSPQQAAEALRDVDLAQRRSSIFDGYQHAAPHFVLWGIIWAVGYGLTDFLPAHSTAIWGAVLPVGIIAGGFVASRGAKRGFGWRYGAIAATMFVFFASAFFIMSPVTDRQVGAFIPLVVATIYVLMGIWAGPRLVVAGIAVAALTLVGFSLFSEHFYLWMAGVGGGSLVLAGIWLRQV